MLVFALHNSGKLVSIKEVENGKKCNCICPGCKDLLIARNKGSKRSHSFAHTSPNKESRSCFMTALHLFSQEYFLKKTSIELPSCKHKYLGRSKTKPKTITKINDASKEFSLNNNKFFIDVKLNTNVGPIFVEIKVKADCSDEKIAYLKESHIPTLEFDMSTFVDSPFEDVIAALNNAEKHSKWIYGWCIPELQSAIKYDIEVEKEKQRKILLEKITQNKKLTKRAFSNLRKKESIGLPAKNMPFTAIIKDKEFKLKATILQAQSWKLKGIEVYCETEDYLFVKSLILSKNESITRELFILFPYTNDALINFKPIPETAVIYRLFRKGSYPYKWLSFPPLNEIKFEKAKYKAIQLKEDSLDYFNDLF